MSIMLFNIILGTILILVLLQLFTFVKSLLFYKVLSPYWYRPKYKCPKKFPTVHVFVASKGLTNDSETIMRKYANQSYPGSYKVTFITESEHDPGTYLLQNLAEEYEHIFHVVAGRASKCSQKNHNLLKGMQKDRTSEVFAFADADVHVGTNWLRQLVSPLSLGPDWVSTGLPSHTLTNTSLPHLVQAALTAYQAKMMMSVKSIWGGSYAIWRETFERLGTREYWQRTVVDDVSLYQLVETANPGQWRSGKKIKVLPLPELELETFTSHSSIREAIHWFIRQVLYIKFYRRPMWYLAVSANVTGLFIMLVAPFCILLPNHPTLFRLGLLGTAFLVFIQWLNLNLRQIRGKKDCSLLQWSKLLVIGDVVANIALIATLFTNRLVWSGIVYRVDRDGKVKEVIHAGEGTTF